MFTLKENNLFMSITFIFSIKSFCSSTSSNLEEASLTDDQATPSTSTSASQSRPGSRNQNQLSAQDEMFLDAIRNLPAPREATPTPSQSFCLRLADGMDKLPPRVRNQLQLEFLQRLTEMENLYLYND